MNTNQITPTACTVKSYHILKVKQALVKSVLCVAGCSICSFIPIRHITSLAKLKPIGVGGQINEVTFVACVFVCVRVYITLRPGVKPQTNSLTSH
jgi:hypothetical protein